MQSISQFLSDEQDETAVRKILPKVSELLTKDEAVEYIAVQKKFVVNISPDAIVLTNKRFVLVQPSMFGMKFQDFPWREVDNVHMSEQMLGATLTCKTTTGKIVAIESLPKKQARRVYSYAQQIEEQAYEKRQQVELEKMRASAGGVVVHAPVPLSAPTSTPTTGEDPLAALAQLKKLLEAELINPEEFAGKRAEILARL
ncbi:PH domain-containing protein [Luteimonas sp. MJ250]|uniref:PH domain-containing protein n=1 Tax=Luteimonas sp. MJ250 TaxID=3129236 RepID=UPI0031B9D3E0